MQALLTRLNSPTAAALDKEYDNIRSMTGFLNSDLDASMAQMPPSKLDSILQQWSRLAKPFLVVVIEETASWHDMYQSAMLSVGMLLQGLGGCLLCWLKLTAEKDRPAREKQVAKQTAGKWFLWFCNTVWQQLPCRLHPTLPVARVMLRVRAYMPCTMTSCYSEKHSATGHDFNHILAIWDEFLCGQTALHML